MILFDKDFCELSRNLGALRPLNISDRLKGLILKHGYTLIAQTKDKYPVVIIKVNKTFYEVFCKDYKISTF